MRSFYENKNLECDIEVEHDLCLYDGDFVISSSLDAKDLFGYWNFNENMIFDQTSYRSETVYKNINVSPGMTGYGNSGGFKLDSHLLIHEIPNLQTENSLQFQFYLEDIQIEKSQGEYNPDFHYTILEKYKSGKDDSRQINYKLSIIAKTKQLLFHYSVKKGEDEYELKKIKSRASMLKHKWTHIAIVRDNNKYILWVNGFKDTVITQQEKIFFGEENKHSIILGDLQKQDNVDERNQLQFSMDNLKIYNKILQYYEVQAEAERFLGGIAPNQYELQCLRCKAVDMQCEQDYHICSSFELLAGGYQIVRVMGWLRGGNTEIWSLEGIEEVLNQRMDDMDALGLCCHNINSR